MNSRFQSQTGTEGFTGNELLVKGALEAGVSLLTGYPGSPISGVFETAEEMAPFLAEHGLVTHIASNEALAAARLTGACQAGLRAMAVMKSVGLHVAADALATGNLVEFRNPASGGLVVTGDDPWNETTQINSDSRYLSMHLNMPVIEPGSLQELKDWVKAGLELSGASDLFVTMVITVNQGDAGGTVRVAPNLAPAVNPSHRVALSADKIATGDMIMIPPFITQRESSLAERVQRLHIRARELQLDRREGPRERRPVGFIASGLSWAYLKQVLELAGVWGQIPVLKLGLTYPIDEAATLEFAESVDRIVVVEEKRGFVEAQVLQAVTRGVRSGRLSRNVEIWGKEFAGGKPGFPNVAGMNPSIVLEKLAPLLAEWAGWLPDLKMDRVEKRLAQVRETGRGTIPIISRTPTFCPGCPHRDSAVVAVDLKNKMKTRDGDSSPDIILHGESGCHTMLGFPPFNSLMKNYVGMGLGGGAGAGMDPFTTNKHLVFLGDSTFFHSGIVAISDSIKHGQNVTYVILENGTTAMTGHQPTASSPVNISGGKADPQSIQRILEGMAPAGLKIIRLDPSKRADYSKIMEDALKSPGVKVIIADKECAITYHRRLNAEKKKKIAQDGFIPVERRMMIDPEVCEDCRACVQETACPGLNKVDTPLGVRVTTDLSACVDDAACARTNACPSFAWITVERTQAPARRELPAVAAKNFPPVRVEAPETWSAYIAGIGGMGIGVLTGVLARAGQVDGYHVHFVNRKGLAIRNGGVFGHVVFSKKGPIESPFGFYGDVDLVIGLDLLEATRGIHPAGTVRVAHPSRTRAIVDVGTHETVRTMAGTDKMDGSSLQRAIRENTMAGAALINFSDIAEAQVGSKMYSNAVALGFAYQKGWIPFSEGALMDAIAKDVPRARQAENLKAFNVGRALAADDVSAPVSLPAAVEDRARIVEEDLRAEYGTDGEKMAAAFRRGMEEARRRFQVADRDRAYLAQAVGNLLRYGGESLLASFLSSVEAVAKKDAADKDFEATGAAIRAYYPLMTPKDEFWVARLLTSPAKIARDRARYQVDPSRGDSLRYKFLTRPQITLLGRAFEFSMPTTPALLKAIRGLAFLRNVLPGWNARDRRFLAAFDRAVATVMAKGGSYEMLVEALEAGAGVKGFRHVRRRSMEAAEQTLAALLAKIGSGEPFLRAA